MESSCIEISLETKIMARGIIPSSTLSRKVRMLKKQEGLKVLERRKNSPKTLTIGFYTEYHHMPDPLQP